MQYSHAENCATSLNSTFLSFSLSFCLTVSLYFFVSILPTFYATFLYSIEETVRKILLILTPYFPILFFSLSLLPYFVLNLVSSFACFSYLSQVRLMMHGPSLRLITQSSALSLNTKKFQRLNSPKIEKKDIKVPKNVLNILYTFLQLFYNLDS